MRRITDPVERYAYNHGFGVLPAWEGEGYDLVKLRTIDGKTTASGPAVARNIPEWIRVVDVVDAIERGDIYLPSDSQSSDGLWRLRVDYQDGRSEVRLFKTVDDRQEAWDRIKGQEFCRAIPVAA